MNSRARKSDDRQLVKRIANGEKIALQLLFSRHHTRVFRFVDRQVRDASMAEEVTNDVFLDVWRQAGRFEDRSSVTTWLMAMARNKALSALRKRRDGQLDEDYARRIPDEADDSEVRLQKTDKADALATVIARLSLEHRTVIDLVYYQEMSISQVAEVLAIPANTVKTRVFHARKKLAGMMSNAGIDRGWP
ncbi:MAG: sigma-70 family RNA polymerase sigma factor [Alphaproteobacteria bacterium]|nr:sigma-70 family RNA polymerase sigma factor [Alphaproteobacteria bacterium]